jgi:glycosyltransferase involved in cell wall biosynthesis
MPWMFHHLRLWDTVSAARVDRFLANSTFIRQRIQRAWRREASVVYPPVETELFHQTGEIENRWLWVGQMTAYKRADLALDAFNALGLPLLMVGDGEMGEALRRRAGPNITIIPRMSFDELRNAYARCRALVFTAEEDFGLVPVEAMASGRPVLAFGRGGATDTVTPGRTGLFFDEQGVDAVVDGVRRLEAWLHQFDPADAVRSAGRFSPSAFDAGILEATAA